MNYKLSPSDLTFTYEGCKRCFYLKVVKNVTPPSIPLPSIFSKMASLLTHWCGFMDEALGIIENPKAPAHSPSCLWCCYFNKLNDIASK